MELWQIAELMRDAVGEDGLPQSPEALAQSGQELIRARYEAAQNGEPEPDVAPMSDDAVGMMSAAFAMPRGE